MYDVLIIGAGPAGMTAGIYAKRANLKVAIIEKSAPGGQMVQTAEIENYTGFKRLPGSDLALEMFTHAMAIGVEFIFDEVKDVEDGDVMKVILSNSVLTTKTLIIASGAEPRRLGIENEEALVSRGISFCAICDGPMYKGLDIVVVGGGNSAVEESSYLATLANKVTIVQNLSDFTADKKSVEILNNNKNVSVHFDSVVKEFLLNEDKTLKGVTITKNKKEDITILADGVFEFIGLKPTTKAFQNLGILNQYGYIETNEKMETSKKGIYAAGDVRSKQIRQIVTATSDGAIAVQNALRYLETKE